MAKIIGVLGVQGDFALHHKMLKRLGVPTVIVRTSDDLQQCDGLVLPGGESTTFLKLLNSNGLFDIVKDFAGSKPVMGTCAGLIVLAKNVINDDFKTLSVLDVSVERNGYGRQIDSFIDDVLIPVFREKNMFSGVFIRAPRIVSIGKGVEPIGFYGQEPVMVKSDNILALTFHPELTEDTRIHEYFLQEFVGKM
ncbi:pyridoxal 5'-phosphate synthase glutaminase subunit PdxT [bacterium]|nr:pyridoxal 5'-phosphate synthase glutaminase subunit PdxT [bacterium]